MLLLLTVAVVTFDTVVIVVRSIDDATATTYAFTLHRIGIVAYRNKTQGCTTHFPLPMCFLQLGFVCGILVGTYTNVQLPGRRSGDCNEEESASEEGKRDLGINVIFGQHVKGEQELLYLTPATQAEVQESDKVSDDGNFPLSTKESDFFIRDNFSSARSDFRPGLLRTRASLRPSPV